MHWAALHIMFKLACLFCRKNLIFHLSFTCLSLTRAVKKEQAPSSSCIAGTCIASGTHCVEITVEFSIPEHPNMPRVVHKLFKKDAFSIDK